MATAQADIHVKVDPEIKAKSENILGKIGISMSDLINMTLRRVIYEQRIPFDTKVVKEDPPACMRIDSEEELINFLEESIEYNKTHSETYTTEEILKSLGI